MREHAITEKDQWPDAICDGLSLPCQLCGLIPDFDYRVTDWLWREVVTDNLKRGVICLPCLDVIATASGLNVNNHLEEVQFTGRGKTVVLKPTAVYYYTPAPPTDTTEEP